MDKKEQEETKSSNTNQENEQWIQIFETSNKLELTTHQPNKYTFIDTYDKLKIIVKYLNQQSALGIDTEQSFQQTYEGFLCLIQISSLKIDFVIDLLSIPKEKIVECLQPIFANPKIIKVFYAGDSDLTWLDRDFQMKVVNYLDIKLLQEFLNKNEQSSLTYLWKTYCNCKIDKAKKKSMQLSSWEKRPLSQEQLNYASLDTHYLLYLRFRLILQCFKQYGMKETVAHLEKQQNIPKHKVFKEKEYKQNVHAEFVENFIKIRQQLQCPHQPQQQQQQWQQQKPQESQQQLQQQQQPGQTQQQQAKQQQAQQQQEPHEQQKNDEKDHSEEIKIQFDKNPLLNNSKMQKVFKGMYLYFTFLRESKAKEKNVNVEKYISSEKLATILFEFLKNNFSLLPIIKSLETEQFWKDQPEELSQIFQNAEKNQEQYIQRIVEFENNVKQQQNPYEIQKLERRMKFASRTGQNKQVYQNCQILSPQGLRLCNCDENKINWYLKRDLADKVSDKPLVIKLRFQPGGKGHSEIEDEIKNNENCYYTTERKNQCVVCGNQESYMRYHIVPLLYRRFFPNQYKSHRSHDILLLCQDCHEKAGRIVEDKKKKIAEELKIPLITFGENKILQNKLREMIGITQSYFQNISQMQKEKKKGIKNSIRQLYYEIIQDESVFAKIEIKRDKEIGMNKENKIKINDAFKEMCKVVKNQSKNLKDKSNSEFKNYTGKLVIDTLKSEDELKNFIKMWRQFFLDTMQPQFLPSGWSVSHKFNREFGEHSVFSSQQ